MNESTDTAATSRSGRRAESIKQRIKQDGKKQIESGKRAAADQIAEIADAIDVAGSQLDRSQPTLAGYASQLADGVGTLATRLRDDSIEDIYRDMRQLADRHPGMFLLGGAALGLVIARFMKASGEHSGEDEGAEEDLGEEAQSERAQDWGEASDDEAADADSEDVETLARARTAATPDPYGSPAYGA
jgi:hypothetical protein